MKPTPKTTLLRHAIREGCVMMPGTFNAAVARQIERAGFPAVYVSGAGLANAAAGMPDIGLLSLDEVAQLAGYIARAVKIPALVDADTGFGGVKDVARAVRQFERAGLAGLHLEDQVFPKRCGHLGGKEVVPAREMVAKLRAAVRARRDKDFLIVARTDARAATLLTSDVDANDHAHITGERTPEGYLRVKPGVEHAITRSNIYAPYADLLWCETSTPDIDEARHFAEAVHAKHPGKMLAYNCSPSFNWKKHLSDTQIARFQRDLGEMGYKFQFVTLAGFHALNESMFDLASGYAKEGMTAYVRLQEAEFALEKQGYTATKHQREVGTGYFDEVYTVISGGTHSTKAMEGSTEHEQFHGERPVTATAKATVPPKGKGKANGHA
jgi:isocitrate lyase